MPQGEEFFEELRKRARRNYEHDHPFQPYTEGAASAIDATIEALREMMVGEPIGAALEHEINQDTESSYTEEWTMIDSHPFHLDRYVECGFRGHHGIPGKALAIIMSLEEEDDQEQGGRGDEEVGGGDDKHI